MSTVIEATKATSQSKPSQLGLLDAIINIDGMLEMIVSNKLSLFQTLTTLYLCYEILLILIL